MIGFFFFYLLRENEEIKYTYTDGAVLSLNSDPLFLVEGS